VPNASSSSSPQRPFLILGTLVLVVAILYWAQQVLIPLALAILLAFILTPLVTFFQRRGLKRLLAVSLVVLLALTFLGGLFWTLALEIQDLSHYMAENSKNISRKIADLQGSEPGIISNLLKVFKEVGEDIQRATGPGGDVLPKGEEPVPVKMVNARPSSGLSWFPIIARPILEVLASAALVVILVIFMLVRREDLRNRMLRLIGHGRVTVTTRALDEATQRISSYLTMQLAINAGFGIVLGLGLTVIGVPYALLWGFLAAVLRFIPYIGTWVLALLPLTISVADPTADWFQPLWVLILISVLELVTANVVEPLLFSHSTGISSIALLVSAAFWTWLWGPIGLVLSTPLSVCLAVLGRYVPHLEFFDVLLGDEPVLDAKVRYYQRLLARDQDEATELVEEYLADHPPETVYDDVLLPALLYAKRDREHTGLPAEEMQFIFQVTRDILDDLLYPQQTGPTGGSEVPAAEPEQEVGPSVLIFACPARDEADELALHMFEQVLACKHCRLEVLSSELLSAEVIARVREERPALLCIGSLPPGGLAQARYLCKRLRRQFPDVKILVGRWGQTENIDKMQNRLVAAGADYVAATLLESRAQALPLLETSFHAQQRATKPVLQAVESR
jgi:predicted PurR-regulated permease PerM